MTKGKFRKSLDKFRFSKLTFSTAHTSLNGKESPKAQVRSGLKKSGEKRRYLPSMAGS